MGDLVLLLFGFAVGAGLMIWFFFGDRLKWGIPAARSIDDDFRSLDPFWTTLCIGDAAVELRPEPGTVGGQVARLVIHEAVEGQLALAQLDDYSYRPFADYPWTPPIYAEARLRFSDVVSPGTAGFWFWNNGMGLGAELPDLRPLKWVGFYRTGPEATVAYSDTDAQFRASVMKGHWPGMARMFGVPLLPRLPCTEAALDGPFDWTRWHTFTIEWLTTRVRLSVDGLQVLNAEMRVPGPLSLVIWCDNNQPYVCNGKYMIGNTAITKPVWLDVDYVRVNALAMREVRVPTMAEAGAPCP